MPRAPLGCARRGRGGKTSVRDVTSSRPTSEDAAATTSRASDSTDCAARSAIRRLHNASTRDNSGKPCAGNPYARFESGPYPTSRARATGKVGSTNARSPPCRPASSAAPRCQQISSCGSPGQTMFVARVAIVLHVRFDIVRGGLGRSQGQVGGGLSRSSCRGRSGRCAGRAWAASRGRRGGDLGRDAL